jgi:hypothetical protein
MPDEFRGEVHRLISCCITSYLWLLNILHLAKYFAKFRLSQDSKMMSKLNR